MRVLWTHNFNLAKLNAGCFMHTALRGLQDIGVDVQLEYLGNLRSPFQMMSSRKRICALSRNFDVVHAQYGSACAWATSAIEDTPLIVTLRGSDFLIGETSWNIVGLHNLCARALTISVLHRFSAVCAISNRMAREITSGGLAKQIIVLPSPLDLDLWRPKAFENHTPNSSAPKNVLFTAQNINVPNKGYALCQRVIKLANNQIQNVQLNVATGIQHADMPQFVANCDAVLCTSKSEGWPNSVKEALACNIPFVSTDVSDLNEIAMQDSSCRVCKPVPELLAKALCEVLQAPRPTNLRRHVEMMDLKSSSIRLYEIYKSLIKN